VTPVDYKRGKRPHIAKGAYDPERVQLYFPRPYAGASLKQDIFTSL